MKLATSRFFALLVSISKRDVLPLCALNLRGLGVWKTSKASARAAAAAAICSFTVAQGQVPDLYQLYQHAPSLPFYQFSGSGGVPFSDAKSVGSAQGCESADPNQTFHVPSAASPPSGIDYPVTGCVDPHENPSPAGLGADLLYGLTEDLLETQSITAAGAGQFMSGQTQEIANPELGIYASASLHSAGPNGGIIMATVTFYQQNLLAIGMPGQMLTLNFPVSAEVSNFQGQNGSAASVGVCVWSDTNQACKSWGTGSSPGIDSTTLTVSVVIGPSQRFTISLGGSTLNQTPNTNSWVRAGFDVRQYDETIEFNTFDVSNDPNSNTTVRKVSHTGEKGGYESPNGGTTRGWIDTGSTPFTTFTLVAPGDNTGFTVVDDLNDSGTAAGWFKQNVGGVTNSHGFLFNNGSYKIYDVNGAESTQIVGINNKGDFVGNFTRSGQPDQGFLQLASTWHPPATFAIPNATLTLPAGVNNSDVIVGRWVDSNGGSHGFVTTAGNPSPLLFDFPGATNTFPYSITDAGAISGQFIDSAGIVHGFVGPPAAMVQYDLAGVLQTGSYALNNQGVVAGHYLDTSGIAHGFTAQLCDTDISNQFKIAAGGFLLNHTTDEYTQQIVLTNTSGQPISGPLLILFKNLPGPVIMDNGNQLSVCASPGAPYLTVNPAGGSLLPGQSVKATAIFANYSTGAITYTPAVLSGSGGTIP